MIKKMSWTLDKLMETFHLRPILEGCETLDKWLAVENGLGGNDIAQLGALRKKLIPNADSWSEDALKMKFLAFLMAMVDYDTDKYEAFYDNTISAKVDGETLTAKADLLVAKGTGDAPRMPYFCFHEYKKNTPDKDPRSQLFQGMLIAQAVNKNEKPIYGAYIIGKAWNFTVLQPNRIYCISRTYDATLKDDLQRILLILKKFKWILDNELLVN
jgi:hypothetical protein